MASAIERARAEKERLAKENARRAKFYSWIERQEVRIMPPYSEAGDWFRVFGKHFGLGPDGKTVVFCPRVCFGADCPICNSLRPLWKGASKEQQEWLRKVGATPRYFLNIVAKHELEKGVQVAEVPQTILEELVNLMTDEVVACGDFTDMTSGNWFVVEKTGSGIGTKWKQTAQMVKTPADAAWLPNIVNLDELIRLESYENLKLIWEGKEPKALPAPETTVIVATPPAEATETTPPDVVDTSFREVAPAAAPAGPPPCFGGFNEDLPKCLDCIECDDCEEEGKRRKKAAAAAASVATPAPAESLSVEELMAEMEKAIG